jgi:hypothetical protein
VDPELAKFAEERAAAKAQYDADAARHQQGIGARAGVSGMGLFGGTSTALADASRVDSRNETLGLADLGAKQKDQQFLDLRRQALTDELEYDEDTDIDGDGKVAGQVAKPPIGDGDPTNNETAIDRIKRQKAEAGGDLAHGGQERGEIAGFHPGTNDFQVDPDTAKQAHESPNIPLVGTYLGSDGKWNYFRDADGSIVKVRR